MSDYRPLTLILFVLFILSGAIAFDWLSLVRCVLVGVLFVIALFFEGKRDRAIESLRLEIQGQKASHEKDLQVLRDKVNSLSFTVAGKR